VKNPLENLSASQAEPFWRLLKIYELTDSGFITFAIYAQGKDWDVIKTALEAEPKLNVKTIFVPSGNISANDPNFLPSLRAIGEQRSLVLLRVDLGVDDEGLKHFCGYLNFHREEIVGLKHGIVIWTTDPVLTVIARTAPDTFAVKRGVLDFRSELEIKLPLGDSGLWLRDVETKKDEFEELQELLELEKKSENPDWSYVVRLELRLTSALYKFGNNKKASLIILRAISSSRAIKNKELLAESLNMYGIILSGLGKIKDALKVSKEATQVYRELVSIQPDMYLQDLAGSLSNLEMFYGMLGRLEDALKASKEVTQIYRELANIQPRVHPPELTGSIGMRELRMPMDLLLRIWESVTFRFRGKSNSSLPNDIESPTNITPDPLPDLLDLLSSTSLSVSDDDNERLYKFPVPQPWVGQAVRDLEWQPEVLLVAILRDGHVRVPRGISVLEANDELVILSDSKTYSEFRIDKLAY
jgi:tetratricopeptide (TPR) repeat protein